MAERDAAGFASAAMQGHDKMKKTDSKMKKSKIIFGLKDRDYPQQE